MQKSSTFLTFGSTRSVIYLLSFIPLTSNRELPTFFYLRRAFRRLKNEVPYHHCPDPDHPLPHRKP